MCISPCNPLRMKFDWGATGHQERNGVASCRVKATYEPSSLLVNVQELIPRVCQLAKLMDCDSDTVQLGDKIWQSGIVPNSPRLCSNLLRSFPGHPANLEPDKAGSSPSTSQPHPSVAATGTRHASLITILRACQGQLRHPVPEESLPLLLPGLENTCT